MLCGFPTWIILLTLQQQSYIILRQDDAAALNVKRCFTQDNTQQSPWDGNCERIFSFTQWQGCAYSYFLCIVRAVWVSCEKLTMADSCAIFFMSFRFFTRCTYGSSSKVRLEATRQETGGGKFIVKILHNFRLLSSLSPFSFLFGVKVFGLSTQKLCAVYRCHVKWSGHSKDYSRWQRGRIEAVDAVDWMSKARLLSLWENFTVFSRQITIVY